MTTPNQITACATSSLQGVYVPEVRIYAETPHPRYGLLADHYFFKGKTRDRKAALAAARAHIAAMKGMTTAECRAYLDANGRKNAR